MCSRSIEISIIFLILCSYAYGDTCKHRFKVLGHGIVTDTQSGLIWKRCPMGMQWNNKNCLGIPDLSSWSNADILLDELNQGGGYGGFSDWRLPTHEQLSNLVKSSCSQSTFNTIFPNTPNLGFWSSTPDIDTGYPYSAWLVYFPDGYSYVGDREFEWAIRAVRN